MSGASFDFFAGTVTVVDALHDSPEQRSRGLAEAEHRIGAAACVGLDFEWTPDFHIPLSALCPENPGNPIALIQVALVDGWVFLYRHFQEFPLPGFLKTCLLSEQQRKYVLAFDLCDKLKLKTTFDLEIPAAAISEVSDESGGGLKTLALRRGQWLMRKSKKIGTSEWGARASRLTDAQIKYAAEDAFFTLMLGLLRDQHTDDLEISRKFLKRQGQVLLGEKRRSMDEDAWRPVTCEDERKIFRMHEDLFELRENAVKRKRIAQISDPHAADFRSVTVGDLEKLLAEYAVGQYVTDRVLIAGLRASEDALDCVTADDRKFLELLASGNSELIDFSYDGDRRLGLYRLKKHPRRLTVEKVSEILSEIIDASRPEAKFIDTLVAEAEISDFVGEGTEEATRVVFSLVSKIKIRSDEISGVDVSSSAYKKHTLNMWVRELRRKLAL